MTLTELGANGVPSTTKYVSTREAQVTRKHIYHKFTFITTEMKE